MEKVKSCGFLVYRNLKAGEDGRNPGLAAEGGKREFLLMKHADRWDLPKGHVDAGETNRECALRELMEETSIAESDIRIDAGFKFKSQYKVAYKNRPGETKRKTLIIYLAELIRPVEIVLTEHLGFEWVTWQPPHAIQEKTIDPLLQHLADHWQQA